MNLSKAFGCIPQDSSIAKLLYLWLLFTSKKVEKNVNINDILSTIQTLKSSLTEGSILVAIFYLMSNLRKVIYINFLRKKHNIYNL